jgi:hypothetical protein
MTLKERLTTFLPAGKKRMRIKIAAMLTMCILLCGFTWTWFVEFTASVIFPFNEAVDTNLILNFADTVNASDLQIYLTEPLIADQLLDGIHSNISGRVYDSIELPEMREESLGRKIIRVIFDRLFS